MNTVVIDDLATEQRLTLAAELLERSSGIVVLDGVVTLWPRPNEIECAVTLAMTAIARCEEEYKVLVENAAHALRASKLGPRMPRRHLRWVVIDHYGKGSVELWRAR